MLMEILEGSFGRLKAAHVRGEFWIGGSFVTAKPDPADIDIVLRMRSTWLEDASTEQLAAVRWFVKDLKQSEQIDSYMLIEWPRSHENYWVGEYWYAYWVRQWGFDREDSLRGIAVVRLRG